MSWLGKNLGQKGVASISVFDTNRKTQVRGTLLQKNKETETRIWGSLLPWFDQVGNLYSCHGRNPLGPVDIRYLSCPDRTPEYILPSSS